MLKENLSDKNCSQENKNKKLLLSLFYFFFCSPAQTVNEEHQKILACCEFSDTLVE